MNHSFVSPSALLALFAGSALSAFTPQAQAQAPCVDPFPHPFELSSLLGNDGFVLNGIDAIDSSGWSVSSAGDVNGDGIDDLIIGAYLAEQNGIYFAGESYVVFGGSGVGAGGVFDLSTLNGPNGFVINGIHHDDCSGFSVSSAGDVNGDGIDDLIIGAYKGDPNENDDAGESYVVFGALDLGTPGGVGEGGSFELSSLLPINGGDGTNGFVLNGIDVDDFSGKSVSSAGDVNGDGIDDLIIGADSADPNVNSKAGESYVVFGGLGLDAGGELELSSLNGANGFVLNGIDEYDHSGRSVSSAGDVNGDGFDDLIIGAHAADPNGNSNAGESYVVFGAADLGTTGVGAGGSFDLSALNGANGFVLNGIDALGHSGRSVSSAGDVNGDGFDDLIIGAYYAGTSTAGESYVVFGASDLGTTGVGTGGSFNLSAINGANGFVLNGIVGGDRSGFSVSSAGDVNGDGIDDLIIGAYKADPNGIMSTGESYVVFGDADLGTSGAFDLSDLDSDNGFVLEGIVDNDYSGFSVSSAGDVNGDGIDDLIIGAWSAEANWPTNAQAGESYVVFGRNLSPCLVDLNNDCYVDSGDIGIFVDFFLLQDPSTDLNFDGFFDSGDLNLFVALFTEGCY